MTLQHTVEGRDSKGKYFCARKREIRRRKSDNWVATVVRRIRDFDVGHKSVQGIGAGRVAERGGGFGQLVGHNVAQDAVARWMINVKNNDKKKTGWGERDDGLSCEATSPTGLYERARDTAK